MAGGGFQVMDDLREYKRVQLAKDFKLSLAVMVSLLIILFHYLYIMKQLMDNREMTYKEIGIQFGFWGVTSSGVLYCLVSKVYPVIAGDSIESEKKNE